MFKYIMFKSDTLHNMCTAASSTGVARTAPAPPMAAASARARSGGSTQRSACGGKARNGISFVRDGEHRGELRAEAQRHDGSRHAARNCGNAARACARSGTTSVEPEPRRRGSEQKTQRPPGPGCAAAAKRRPLAPDARGVGCRPARWGVPAAARRGPTTPHRNKRWSKAKSYSGAPKLRAEKIRFGLRPQRAAHDVAPRVGRNETNRAPTCGCERRGWSRLVP